MEHSNPPHDSRPFFRTPVRIAPLNITPRSYVSTPLSPKSKPTSPIIQRAPMTPQSMLEGNVRILYDMVDNVMKTNTEHNHRPLCVDTSLFGNGKTCADQHIDPKSPTLAFSSRKSSLAQVDIPRADDNYVPRLSQDSLLNLFPTPPSRVKSLFSQSPMTPESSITESNPTSLHLGDVPKQTRPRKSSKNRNCVISSGLFLTPPTEDGQKPSFSMALNWNQMKGDKTNHHPSASCHPLSPCTPLVQDNSIRSSQEMECLTDIPDSDACPTSPSTIYHSSVTSPISPRSSLDALSQHLWDIETQMRRPSFLMSSRRASVLSALFVSNAVTPIVEKCDQQERVLTDISLSVGPIAPTPQNDTMPKKPQAEDIKQPLRGPSQETDWRAWQGAWNRRTTKPGSETLNSSSSTPRTSYSSFPNSQRCSTENSSAFPSPSTPTFSSWANQRAELPRKNRNISSPLSHLSGHDPHAPYLSTAASPIKNPNAEQWENEGLKWGDRFQSLVHNFQSTAGRHSKRFVDILPMNRWSKRSSRSRSTSVSEKAKE